MEFKENRKQKHNLNINLNISYILFIWYTFIINKLVLYSLILFDCINIINT